MNKEEELKQQLNINLYAILKNVYNQRTLTSEAYVLIMEDLELYADGQSRETAIQFKMDTGPLTPQIVDGEKKVQESIEKLYDNWHKKKH